MSRTFIKKLLQIHYHTKCNSFFPLEMEFKPKTLLNCQGTFVYDDTHTSIKKQTFVYKWIYK